MRARRGLLGWLLVALLAQASCAEIPTAPKRLVTLEGTILTRDGDPVAEAQVYFGVRTESKSSISGSEFQVLYQATTANDGTYTLDLAERTYEVQVSPDYREGIQSTSVPGIRVAGEHPRFDYTYGGVRLEGIVRDPHGSPCPLVDLAFYSVYRPQTPSVYVTYRSYGGHFRVYLPPGDYDFRARPVSNVSGVPSLVFRASHFAADSTFDIVLTGRRVSGRTTGPDGTPLAGVTIFCDSDDYTSAAAVNSLPDGSYEFYVPDGVYRMEAFPALDDVAIQSRPFGPVVISGDLNRDLAFTGAWWQGTVRSPEDGSPVAGALVVAQMFDVPYQYGTGSARARTDANGAYRLSVVSAAWHRIYVETTDRQSSVAGPIPAGADSTIDLVAGALSAQAARPVPRGARAGAE